MFQIFKGITVGIIMVLALFAFSNTPAFAADLVPTGNSICGKDGNCPLIGTSSLGSSVSQGSIVSILVNAARFLTFIGVGLSVLFMVWGGIRYITSGGSDGSKEGKNILINATIGLVVSIVAFTVVNILANFLSGNIASSIVSTS